MEVRIMNKRWIVDCLTLLILSGASAVYERAYSQSKELTTEELAARADLVAIGKVTSLHSEWNNERTRIVTRVTVAVDQYLKGDQPQRTLAVTVPGGEVDGEGELYSHAARFTNNEEVVVFAERDPRGGLRVSGGGQGKFSVMEEKSSGKKMVGENQLLELFTLQIKNAVKAQK
jgi:hypothetical protein